jgi:hypothetical protein
MTMTAADRPDASLLTDAALLEELKRRREARATGVCDYCGARATAENACEEPARHDLAARTTMLVWAKLDAPLAPGAAQRLRDAQEIEASGAPPARPAISLAGDALEAELVAECSRELARLRRRDIPVDLAVLMSEIGDVALALTERGAPSRGELVQVAATALAWADVAQRTGLGVAAARDRAADAREIAAPRNESRFACLDRAIGPAARTQAAVLLRQVAAERVGRRGGIVINRHDGARLLALLEAPPDAPASLLAGEAAVALAVGARRKTGTTTLSGPAAVALAQHLEERALAMGGGGQVPRATMGPNQ